MDSNFDKSFKIGCGSRQFQG